MKIVYRDALLEFVAMNMLIEEYRGRQDLIAYRATLHDKKIQAEFIISRELNHPEVFSD